MPPVITSQLAPAETGTTPVDGGGLDGAWADAGPAAEGRHAKAAVPDPFTELLARYRELSKESLARERAAFERGCAHQEELHRIRTDGDGDIAKIIASRRLSFSNPPQVAGEGFVYVIKFSTGTVKVGQTVDPRQRLGTHQAEAAVFGVGIANYLISPSHRNFAENESALIGFCRGISRRTRREYYHEAAYETVVDFAVELDFQSDISNQVLVEFPAR